MKEKYIVPYIQLEPTTKCNYTCGFCIGRHMKQRSMQFNTFTSFIDSITWLKHIHLQWEWEPLLHPDFFSMIEYVRQAFPTVKISFITNGSFLEKNAFRLLQYNISSILVSIESPIIEEFKSIRWWDLNKVISWINLFMEEKKKQNIATTLWFSVTVLKQTIPHLEAIAKLYTDLKLDGWISIHPLQWMGHYRNIYNESMRRNMLDEKDRKLLNDMKINNKLISKPYNTFVKSQSFYADLVSSYDVKWETCPWLENAIYVPSDGSITTCCFLKDITGSKIWEPVKSIKEALEKRKQLLHTLKSWTIPSQCDWCSTAKRVVAWVKI